MQKWTNTVLPFPKNAAILKTASRLAVVFVLAAVSAASAADEKGWLTIVQKEEVEAQAEPKTFSAVVGKLAMGDQVKWYEHRGDWYRIELRGKPAWIYGDFA